MLKICLLYELYQIVYSQYIVEVFEKFKIFKRVFLPDPENNNKKIIKDVQFPPFRLNMISGFPVLKYTEIEIVLFIMKNSGVFHDFKFSVSIKFFLSLHHENDMNNLILKIKFIYL